MLTIVLFYLRCVLSCRQLIEQISHTSPKPLLLGITLKVRSTSISYRYIHRPLWLVGASDAVYSSFLHTGTFFISFSGSDQSHFGQQSLVTQLWQLYIDSALLLGSIYLGTQMPANKHMWCVVHITRQGGQWLCIKCPG